jgi:NAD(P)-dependent dehydrogenase (short-subunit alcohol dehydrogenase family)
VVVRIDLTGKKALVTGSSQGIGLAIVSGLAAAGASVVLTGRDAAKLEAAAAGIDGEVTTVAGDVTTDEGTAHLLAAAPDVDVLVNNLGVFGAKPALEITDAEWRQYFETNVLAGVRLTRAYLPGMRERGWGRIQYIASDSAVTIPAEMIHYGMTKTAQLAISRGLAELTSGTGVTVNSVLPGPTRSEGVEEFLKSMARETKTSEDEIAKNFVAEHRPTSLLQRFASVEEVANMVVYACSRESSATNGAALRVEGGIVRSIT